MNYLGRAVSSSLADGICREESHGDAYQFVPQHLLSTLQASGAVLCVKDTQIKSINLDAPPPQALTGEWAVVASPY